MFVCHAAVEMIFTAMVGPDAPRRSARNVGHRSWCLDGHDDFDYHMETEDEDDPDPLVSAHDSS